MSCIPDFDTDAILSDLGSIGQKYPEGSPERDAIELAQIALIYPRHVRREDDFRRFYRDCFDPSFKLTVSHEFATQEDADKWIVSGQAKDAERVRIAGKAPRRNKFSVWMKGVIPIAMEIGTLNV